MTKSASLKWPVSTRPFVAGFRRPLTEIKFDEAEGFALTIVDGFVHYNGMYYGDWSVFDGPPGACEEESLCEFAPDLASVPEMVEVNDAV